jgi:hypothetical protein
MATTDFNDAISPDQRSDTTEHEAFDDQRYRKTTVRLLIGAGAAIGFAPLLPWVHYTGLIQTEAQPGAIAVLIGWAFGALLIVAGVRTSRSTCSVRLAAAAIGASVLSALTAFAVAVGSGAHSSEFEKAQPGLGVYVLLLGAAAGILGTVRSYRRRS